MTDVMRLLGLTCRLVIVAYRWTVSPLLHALFPGMGCRFHPTCSEYALECFKSYAPWNALYLSVRRVARCHPYHPGGYDPVPDSDPKGRKP